MRLKLNRLNSDSYHKAYQNCSLFRDMSEGEENLQAFLANPDCILITAEVDGKQAGQVAGYVLRRWDGNEPKLFLYTIDVLEEYREKGIGSALVRQFKRTGRKAGCREGFVFTCESNQAAMNLYSATEGRRIYPDDVMFIWNLLPCKITESPD